MKGVDLREGQGEEVGPMDTPQLQTVPLYRSVFRSSLSTESSRNDSAMSSTDRHVETSTVNHVAFRGETGKLTGTVYNLLSYARFETYEKTSGATPRGFGPSIANRNPRRSERGLELDDL